MTPSIRTQLAVFTVLFAAGMWLSKIAQPLYFERLEALVAFGIGYAVMAVVGGFSFLWGAAADRFGGLNTVKLGAVLYCVGIAGRLNVDVVPVIVFSALAGAGASMALVGLRPWIRNSVSEQEVLRVVGSRVFSSQLGTFAGTLGASGIFLISASAENGQTTALIVAPCLVAAAAVWLFFVGRSSETKIKNKVPTDDQVKSTLRKGNLVLALKLGLIGVLSGFYVSLIAPYMPLILTSSGASAAEASLVVALMSAAQIGMSFLVSKRGTGSRPFALFALTELAAGIITLVMAVIFDAMWLSVLLVIRAAFVAVSVIAEETIQYAVLPATSAGLLFGISQSAFLVGDALGGAIGAPIWLSSGPQTLLVTAGVITVLNAFLLPLLLRNHKESTSNLVNAS